MGREKSSGSRIGFIVRLVLSAGMLAVALYVADPGSVWKTVGQANVRLVALFFPVFLAIGLIGAIRWRLLLICQKVDITLWGTVKLTLVGLFFSNFLPGLTGGDVVKAVYAARSTPHKTRAVVSVFMDRLVGTVSLGIIALVGTLVWHESPIAKRAMPVVAVLLVFVGGLCAAFLGGRLFGMERLAKRFPLGGMSQELLKARDYYGDSKLTLLVALGLSFLGHLGCVLVFYGYGLALGVDVIGFSDYLIAVPTISFIGCLPVSIMGWGIGELSSKWLLTSRGVAEHVAVAISIMYRASLVAWSIPGGFMAMFYGIRKPDPGEVPGPGPEA